MVFAAHSILSDLPASAAIAGTPSSGSERSVPLRRADTDYADNFSYLGKRLCKSSIFLIH